MTDLSPSEALRKVLYPDAQDPHEAATAAVDQAIAPLPIATANDIYTCMGGSIAELSRVREIDDRDTVLMATAVGMLVGRMVRRTGSIAQFLAIASSVAWSVASAKEAVVNDVSPAGRR